MINFLEFHLPLMAFNQTNIWGQYKKYIGASIFDKKQMCQKHVK